MKAETQLRQPTIADRRESQSTPVSSLDLPKEIQRETSSKEKEQLRLTTILVVDADQTIRQACVEKSGSIGYQVDSAVSVAQARSILSCQLVDLLLLDLTLPGVDLSLLQELKAMYPEIVVVVMTTLTAACSPDEASLIEAGHCLTKPFAPEELTAVLHRVQQRGSFDRQRRSLRDRLRTQTGMGNLIGRSPKMETLYRTLSKVTASPFPVLILGETGTGKELVARSIHFNGPNAAEPFIAVDCGSLTSTLLESELFGYVKGAFTGANTSKVGLLAAAKGGTVFLDEIGELSLDLQAKLLRVLQEKEVRPVGSTQTVPITARVIAATHRNIEEMVKHGQFRLDLHFRLNVVKIRVPPLRERRADIVVLAEHFLKRIQRDSGVEYTLSQDTLRAMTEYDWPGNVRELEHSIARACALSSGPILHRGDLPTQLQKLQWGGEALPPTIRKGGQVDPSQPYREPRERVVSIAEMEKQTIIQTMSHLKGDKLLAAKLLGIGKTTLYRKLKEYGFTAENETDV